MAKGKKVSKVVNSKTHEVDVYAHEDKKRLNNPPVGMAQYDTAEEKKKTYAFDPNLDPTLEWAGKAERNSFEIPTSSLHIHEVINPLSIISAVRTEESDPIYRQYSLWDKPQDIMRRRRESIEFYKHDTNWTNRLIAGDSLMVMNSLLEKEGMSGKVQTVYIDPPYGIKYGSNFQPFTNNRDVKDNKDNDLTQEPEMIKAFRDTWELGIHSYLTYLRDRLLLARELLSESGSVFVQISDENVHLIRNLCDEVFGVKNFICLIPFAKTASIKSNYLSSTYDYIMWYGKDKQKTKYRQLFVERSERTEGGTYNCIELEDGTWRRLSQDELLGIKTPPKGKIFRAADISRQGESSAPTPYIFEEKTYYPSKGRHWATKCPDGLDILVKRNRIVTLGNILSFKIFDSDFPYMKIDNVWADTIIGTFTEKLYVVQTATKVISRCILMTTDPGDLVLDITCGSGTTAYVAEQWGRRWITCDTSRVAITLAKQRLLTATYDYYQLAYPEQGVGSGFIYKTVPHITLKTLANNEPSEEETLYDKPIIDKTKIRITGPFTVEALPSPVVKPLDDLNEIKDYSSKQTDWRDELFATGILGRNGQKMEFSRVEPLSGTQYLQAEAETKEANPQRTVICFGSETKPLDSRMVNLALSEAETLRPSPKLIVFAAFQFDPEAAKDIDETNWPGVTMLKVQMNTDLLTEDLKKKRSSNQSFWLVGQPDVAVFPIEKGKDKGKYKVVVNGFDYYDVKNGTIESGDSNRIAMWMLDTDYDGLCIKPTQLFFPMSGSKDGWSKLAKTLKAEIDQDLIENYAGNESLPFSMTFETQIAVKIIDDRGIESLKVIKAGGR